MCNTEIVDTVSWYAEESVRLSVEPWRCGKRVEIPEGATAAWVVCDEGGTNWIVRYDAAPASNRCAFALSAGEGNLPFGHDYTGYVSLLSGTNILGVLDRHEVRVLGQAADGGSPVSPDGGAWGSLLARMAEAEAGIQGLAMDVATNAAAIAELEAATNALNGRAATLETAVGSRLPAGEDIDAEGHPWAVHVLTEFRGGVEINETGGGMGRWPRIEGAIASNAAAISANASAIATNAAAIAELEGATNALDAAIATNAAAIAAHVADTDNPHGVTAEQAGALPVSGGTVDGDIVLFTNAPTTTPAIIFDRGVGGTAVDWKIQNQAGTLRFQNRPGNDAAWRTPGVVVSTGCVVTATGFSGGGDDLTVGTNTLGSWVPAAEAAAASVERRVARLEYPETCALYWDPDFVTSNWDEDSSAIYVPTNFPTKRLELVVCDNGISNLYIRLPGWQPDRDVEVVICVLRDTGDSVGRASRVQYLSQLLVNHTAANNYRLLICDYDSFAKTWSFYPQTLASRPYYGTNARKDFPSNFPATVEEWLALHPEWAGANAAQQSAQQLSDAALSPFAGGLSPAVELQEEPEEETEAEEDEPGEEERCEEYSLANGGWPNPDIPAPPVSQ